MLPLNAKQISYQDVGGTVWKHKQVIEKYAQDKVISFDIVISKLRNGIHTGSIVSTYLRLPFGVVEVNPADGTTSILWPTDVDRTKPLNVLAVDTVSNSGTSLQDMVAGILKEQSNAQVHTYATFVAAKSLYKPSIQGEVITDYIQTPWEWLSYTPASHLERLENNNDSIFSGNSYFIAVSSREALDKLEIIANKKISSNSIMVYQNYAANKNVARSNSGLSTLDVNSYRNKGIDVYYGALKRVIEDKVLFITKNGVTHFIEDNLEEAVVIAQRCPVTHVLYIEKDHLIRIYNYDYNIKNLGI